MKSHSTQIRGLVAFRAIIWLKGSDKLKKNSMTSSEIKPANLQLIAKCRMVSSGMLRRVALVRTDISEELSAFFIRVTRIGD
jgi:hypothetical protein